MGGSEQVRGNRVGETLGLRVGGVDLAVRCERDAGCGRVYWSTADGAIVGRMDARLWDLNRTRQGLTEGGEP